MLDPAMGRDRGGSQPREGGEPMRLRRKKLSINTERRFEDGVASAAVEDNVARETGRYVSMQRQRRVRKGDILLRRCFLVFLVSMSIVFTAPQYTHRYYLSLATAIVAFFLMLPSVLPSDNSRIGVMLVASNHFCVCIGVFSGLNARRHWKLLDSGDCERATGAPAWSCAWNVAFWSAHTAFPLSLTVVWAHAALRLAPADGLNRFWKFAGFYFIAIALFSLADKALSPAYRRQRNHLAARVFWWNMLLTAEEFAVGALCLSNRFKLWIWRHAASYASITVRDAHSTKP